MKINSKLTNLSDDDFNELYQTLALAGSVTIPNFLDEQVADDLERFFNSEMPEDWWSAASYPTETGEISYIRNYPQNSEAIQNAKNYADSFFYNDSLASGQSGRLAYHFFRTLGNHVSGCYCAECKFREWLLSPELLGFLSKLSGDTYTSFNTTFASRYSEGCFLSPHTDYSNGDIGFVYQLTRDWKPQWGGILHFMDDEGKTITGSKVPTFNSLTLFHLPEQQGKWHYVSHVNPGVKSNRIAYTGWFRK